MPAAILITVATIPYRQPQEASMLALEEIRRRLRQENIAEVAAATGLHYNTPRFVRDGRLDNPTMKTMQALSTYFEQKDAANAI